MAIEGGEILRCLIRGVLDDGTEVLNRKTWKANLETDMTAAAALTAVELWVEEMYGEVVGDIGQNVAMAECDLFVIDWDVGEGQWLVDRVLGQFTPTVAFASTSEELPNQCAPFLIGNTQRPKSRGRLFVFPFTEETQDHGEMIALSLTHLGNMLVDYIGDITVAAGHVLASGIVREATSDFYPFISGVVNDIIGTQRSRRFSE